MWALRALLQADAGLHLLPDGVLVLVHVDEVDQVLIRLQGGFGMAAVQAQLLLEFFRRHVRALGLAVENLLLALPDPFHVSLEEEHVGGHDGGFLQEGGLGASPREAVEHPALHLAVALLDALDDELRGLLLLVVAGVAHGGRVHPGLLEQVACADVLQAEVLGDPPGPPASAQARGAGHDDPQGPRRRLGRQALEHELQGVRRLVDHDLLQEVVEQVIGALLLEVLLDLVQTCREVRLMLHGDRVLQGGARRITHCCPSRQ
mmetsp:Transcript_17267/g.51781  ORF Transcript_17267/g.51781 Transcript_17267/m.51781 type:complete len:262 (-) Transcript_17267:59-844(-)